MTNDDNKSEASDFEIIFPFLMDIFRCRKWHFNCLIYFNTQAKLGFVNFGCIYSWK